MTKRERAKLNRLIDAAVTAAFSRGYDVGESVGTEGEERTPLERAVRANRRLYAERCAARVTNYLDRLTR